MCLFLGFFTLEPMCFSLSDEVGHYEVIESLTESVDPPLFVHSALYCCVRNYYVCTFVSEVPSLEFSSVFINKLIRCN
jgi:hypothetical protein